MNAFITFIAYRLKSLFNLRRTLARQSAFKNAFILLFSAGLLLSMWWIFRRSFLFMDAMGGIGMIIVPKLFSLFFMGLMLLLFLSGILSTYTTLYRSREMAFLLLQPAKLDAVIAFKLVETACYASWAFFFIIIPFVSAYASHEHLSHWFMLCTLLYAIPFVLTISFLSSLLTILLVRFVPRNPKPLLFTLFFFLLAGLFFHFFHGMPLKSTRDTSIMLLDRLIPGLNVASHPLLPSRWLANGLLAIPRGQTGNAIGYLLVLCAHACVFFALALEAGNALFYAGWQRTLVSQRTGKRKEQSLSSLYALLRCLPQDLRAMLIKDLRMFLRDPQQWLQVVFFFGLLSIYFASLRSVHYQHLEPIWKNLITFLNIFSIACVLTSLGSRFIFPQISLEGQAFWIIGMAPTSMGRMLRLKFILSATSMLLISLSLISLAARSLNVDSGTYYAAIFTACCIALSIAALSTGTGAIFMNLDQSNPTAIVSSFGGTLNLVLCLFCLLTAILPFGVLYHSRLTGHLTLNAFRNYRVIIAGYVALQTTLFTVIPLYLGRTSLEKRDY
ncbi:MAG: hypothetical protein EOL87_12630 [Spartobacteria bacterium]|nr:hypothetical protein [Spartobacteria bacterium]